MASCTKWILNIHSFTIWKKRTIACWSHLLMTYSSEKIPWNFHTSLRSHLKNSCFGFYQGFQTLRNNKSTRPKRPRAFICFSVFGTPDKTLALVVDILLVKSCKKSKQHAGKIQKIQKKKIVQKTNARPLGWKVWEKAPLLVGVGDGHSWNWLMHYYHWDEFNHTFN